MKSVIRMTLYFLGLFIIAIGINLAIISNLGVSPVSAFTVPVSQITEISLGTVTVIIYSLFVLIQIVILGKKFRWKNLLQVPFSFAMGIFIDYTGMVLEQWITVNGYGMQLLLIISSIVICAFGATIYIAMDVVPNPPEGLILAICERTGISFGKIKMWSDWVFILIGLILSIIFLGYVSAIREGTILCALFTGKLFGIFQKQLELSLIKIQLN